MLSFKVGHLVYASLLMQIKDASRRHTEFSQLNSTCRMDRFISTKPSSRRQNPMKERMNILDTTPLYFEMYSPPIVDSVFILGSRFLLSVRIKCSTTIANQALNEI